MSRPHILFNWFLSLAGGFLTEILSFQTIIIKQMEINNIKGEIIYQTDKDNVKDTVEEAVKSGANLGSADLRSANLYGANLYGANLYGADLRSANLRSANLSDAYLYGADLSGAYLYGAYLRSANLYGANLSGAYLYGAYLRSANLYGANLYGANLGSAYLRSANLSDAYLYGANLYGAKNIPFIPIACPSDGEFTGWKKVHGKLIELRIPADAKRSSATTNKCRCDKALVVSISDIKTGGSLTECVNYNYTKITYRVGGIVLPDSFDEDRWVECGHGIHFFIDKESAINY